VKLYCEACARVHHPTDGEVERIVYALEAHQREAPDTIRDPEPSCLMDWLDASKDSEVYLEHVDALVERRRAVHAILPERRR
jgi:hypothetical protein